MLVNRQQSSNLAQRSPAGRTPNTARQAASCDASIADRQETYGPTKKYVFFCLTAAVFIVLLGAAVFAVSGSVGKQQRDIEVGELLNATSAVEPSTTPPPAFKDSDSDWLRAPFTLGASLDGGDSPSLFNSRIAAAWKQLQDVDASEPPKAVLFNYFIQLQKGGLEETNAVLWGLDDNFNATRRLLLENTGIRPVFSVTFETFCGLECVTNDVLQALAARCAHWNQLGVEVVLRFNHEMNGSWYPWSQQPSQYTAVWRRLHTAVHQVTNGTRLMWAPNSGAGYPFAGQVFNAPAGSSAYLEMDTNRDGTVDGSDDPYGPYWPGAEYVDLVGMSAYWFGTQWPYGKNEMPADGAFVSKLMEHDFYLRFAVQERKPIVITETGGTWYGQQETAISEAELKGAWFRQVLGRQTLERFPLVKCAVFFEIAKDESFGAGTPMTHKDWRSTVEPGTVHSLVSTLADIHDLMNATVAASKDAAYWLRWP